MSRGYLHLPKPCLSYTVYIGPNNRNMVLVVNGRVDRSPFLFRRPVRPVNRLSCLGPNMEL